MKRSEVILICPATLTDEAAVADTPDDRKEALALAAEQLKVVLKNLSDGDPSENDLREALGAWVEVHADVLDEKISEVLEAGVLRSVMDGHMIFAVVARAKKPLFEDFADEDEALQRSAEIELSAHCLGVGEFADRFAKAIGVTSTARNDLKLAGELHDLGKADPRFQRMLGATPDKLLAKSTRGTGSNRVQLGARHECYSVALLRKEQTLLASAHDAELVTYLVGSHHGRGRAMHPFCEDQGTSFKLVVGSREVSFRGDARLSAIDSQWTDMFCRLSRKYGPWGLAYLETILRLADHRRSEAEAEGAL
jgi:CRISPR-associated endonuclease/helicase Cas3